MEIILSILLVVAVICYSIHADKVKKENEVRRMLREDDMKMEQWKRKREKELEEFNKWMASK